MAKESGQDGAVTVGGNDYPVLRWTLDQTEPALDTTDSGHAGARTRIPKGIYDWNVSLEGLFDTGATYPAVGDAVAVVLTRSSGNTYSGNGVVVSLPIVTDVEGEAAVSINCEIAGNGVLT